MRYHRPAAKRTTPSNDMTWLYADTVFTEHETGDHPESPVRVTAVLQRLAASDVTRRLRPAAPVPATLEQLARVHSPHYLDSLQQTCEAGGGRIEADTVVSPDSLRVATLAAGSACDAIHRVIEQDDPTAFCLVRPPGHHALADQAMGFCLLNHIAIGAHEAIAACGLERLLIVDWDVHHGNGTQATFWEDGRVGFLSIHRHPFYPGSGLESETGSGAAEGMIVNIPVAAGTPLEQYHARFRDRLAQLAEQTRPQLVLISAGFDAHARDPIGSLGLQTEDFAVLTREVKQVASTYAEGRIVSLLEGGYDPPTLAACVERHLDELSDTL